MFITTSIIFGEEFRSLLHSAFTIKGSIRKPLEMTLPITWREKRNNLHLIHLLEQIVIDFLAHDRVELVSWMRPDEVPDPRRRGLKLSGRTFADEIEVFEETASLTIVDV